jgi:hypothetical protein
MMRNLPPMTLTPPTEPLPGVKINTNSDIHIDNLQGLCTVTKKGEGRVEINSAETIQLQAEALNASVFLNLRSLHSSSSITANGVKIILPEQFSQCNIFDAVK